MVWRTSRACVQQVALDAGQQVARGVVLYPRVTDFVADRRLGGLDARFDLLLLLARAFDLALVAVEHRQGSAEEEAQGVGSPVVELAVKHGADGVVHLALRDLRADFRLRPRLVLAQRRPGRGAAPAPAR